MAKILILEDDPDQQQLIEDTLERDGHKLLLASSVDEGERLLAQQSVDLAVLDMQLPRRPGIDLLRFIRQHKTMKDIPVIVVTAQAGFQQEAEHLGTDLFLLKPVDVIALRTLVRRCLEHPS